MEQSQTSAHTGATSSGRRVAGSWSAIEDSCVVASHHQFPHLPPTYHPHLIWKDHIGQLVFETKPNRLIEEIGISSFHVKDDRKLQWWEM